MTNFYVYILFDNVGTPFYVGKGKGGRWLSHEKARDSNRIKSGIIQRTLKHLGEIPKIKVQSNLTEEQAFTLEKTLISILGRRDLNTGVLANLDEGGTGGDHGEYVKQAKGNWTPEERIKHGETYRQITKQFLASLTPEERATWTATRVEKSQEVLRQKRADPKWVARRGQAIKAGHAARTKEEKAASLRKTILNTAPGRLSASVKRFHASQTPEERRARVIGAQTKEQLSERQKRAASALTPEQRSMRVQQQQANLTEEQKLRRSERAKRLSQGKIWITNGIKSARVSPEIVIPDGWRKGRHHFQAKSRADSSLPHNNSELESPTQTSGPALPTSTSAT